MANRVVPDRQGLISIGKLKENLVTEIELPAPGFEGGSYAVLLQRPREKQPYPVTARTEGNALIWTVQTADTAIPGTGKLECRWYGDNGEVAKSQIYMVRITDGLPDPTEAPEAWEGFMGQVARNAQAAQTAAGEAKASADGAAASAGISQGAAAEAGKQAGAAGDAANAAAAAASAASSAQAGAETAGQHARAAAEAAEESATGAAGSAEAAAQAAQKGENLYNQVKADLAAGKLKGEKGDPGKDAPQIDDSVVSAENPWSSRRIIETLCPPIAETGNPVTCYPVAGYPLGVVAQWEPTQAGEGEPYPAGGGKNLIPYPANSYKYPQSRNGLTVTSNANGSYTVNGTATANTYFSVCDLTKLGIDGFGAFAIGGCPKGGATNMFYLAMYDGAKWTADTGDGNTGTIGTIAPGARIEIAIVAGYTANNLVFWPQLEKGSAPTAYAPYENIRPISGRDSVSVEQCGENLLPFGERLEDIYLQQIMASSDLLLLSKACAGQELTLTLSVDTQNIVFENVDEEWRKRIGFECYGIRADGTEAWDLQCWLSESKDKLTSNGKKTKTVTATMPELVSGTLTFYAQNIKSGSFVAYDFGIYAGTTAPTAYAPYRGDTLALQLPGTVYGGEVDSVTGEGQQEWSLLTLTGADAEGWKRMATIDAGKYGHYLAVPEIATPRGPDILGSIICNYYPTLTANDTYRCKNGVSVEGNNNHYFRIYDDARAELSTSEWKAYLAAQYAAGTPVQIAYKLAEPVPFQATGNGPIMPLEGETNTIMTDADSVAITGRADPAHAIAALQAQLAVATQQLAETQQDVVSTTAMAVDYIYQQDLEDIGLEEVDDSDNQTDTEPVDVPGV